LLTAELAQRVEDRPIGFPRAGVFHTLPCSNIQGGAGLALCQERLHHCRLANARFVGDKYNLLLTLANQAEQGV
jgi:hypothetical protein